MALNFLSFSLSLSPSFSLSPKRPLSLKPLQFCPLLRGTHLTTFAIGPDGKFYPNPSDDDPPEAPEDSMHGVSKFQQIHRQAARARKLEEDEFKKDQSIFLNAIADVEDAPDNPSSADNDNSGDDLFGEIDKAIALKRKEFVNKGLLKPNPKKDRNFVPEIDELQPEEVVDLDEIKELQGLTVVSEDSDEEGVDNSDIEGSDDLGNSQVSNLSSSSSFDIDFDSYGKSKARIVEPKFRMTLSELLDESKVVPMSVFGNLEVEIRGFSMILGW